MVDVLALLDRLSTRLIQCHSGKQALEALLDATLSLHETHLGKVQLLNRDTRTLDLTAHAGFAHGILDALIAGSKDSNSACGRALREERPIAILDVNTDASYAPLRALAGRAGYRAVQSMPLVTSAGELIGMLCTHFVEPKLPSDMVMLLTRLYARLAADKVALLRV
jgi:GAF domain-containing protein